MQGGKILKRGVKTKRSKRRYFELEDSHIISDLAIVFIGFTMFLYGGLSYAGNLPEKYAIAASISSFLFVWAEWIVMTDRITGWRMLLHGLIFGCGIIVLIFLPVVLEIGPALTGGLLPTSNMLTFFSLGIVLLLFGTKSLDVKVNRREKEDKEKEKEVAEKERLKRHIEELETELQKYKKSERTNA